MRVDRPQWLAPSLTCILSSSLKLKAALVGAEARSVEALCTLSLAACVCSVREICTQVTRQTHNGKSRGRTLKYLCAVREICVDAAHDQTCQVTGHNRASLLSVVAWAVRTSVSGSDKARSLCTECCAPGHNKAQSSIAGGAERKMHACGIYA